MEGALIDSVLAEARKLVATLEAAALAQDDKARQNNTIAASSSAQRLLDGCRAVNMAVRLRIKARLADDLAYRKEMLGRWDPLNPDFPYRWGEREADGATPSSSCGTPPAPVPEGGQS